MKKIIFLETDTFDSSIHHLGGHHYASHFKKQGWEVLWITQSINPFSFFYRKEGKERITGYQKGLQKSQDNIFYYTPFTFLPYLKIRLFRSIWSAKNSLSFTFPSVKQLLIDTGFLTTDILFVNNIKLISILNLIKINRGIVTRIPDNLSEFSHNPSNIKELEKFVIEKSNLVLCTTKNLVENSKAHNHNSYLLPNGVDYQKFTELHEIPAELKRIPGKKVIYVGNLSDWFDFEVLTYACQEMKDTSFIIIGPINYNKNYFINNKFKNLHYLGPKSYEVIPHYLSNCNCGIIPFKVNKLTDEVSPIKMFEYFASGIPVVSSEMAQVISFSDAVYFYNNKKGFVNSIRAALDEAKEKQKYRIDIAKENSWQTRFEKIIDLINEIS